MITNIPSGKKKAKISATKISNPSETCVSYRYVSLPPAQPSPIDLCLVTVNDSNQNVLVWDNSTNPGDLKYVIYRENYLSGVYETIDTLAATQNEYIDRKTDAGIKSHRYQIATLSVCGIVSEPSPWHRAAHLNVYVNTASDSILMQFEPYWGFVLDTLKILADTTGDPLPTWFELYRITNPAQGLSKSTFKISDYSLQNAFAQEKLRLACDYPKSSACSNLKAENRNSGRSNGDKCCPMTEVVFFASAQSVGTTGPCDGHATIEVFGGTSPYQYHWGAGYSSFDAYRGGLCFGPYTVTVEDANGLTRTVSLFIDEWVGMRDYAQLKGIKAYPNPTQELLTIESQITEVQWLGVYTLSGAMVYQDAPSKGQKIQIPMQNMPSGVYQVHIRTKEGVAVLKIIKT